MESAESQVSPHHPNFKFPNNRSMSLSESNKVLNSTTGSRITSWMLPFREIIVKRIADGKNQIFMDGKEFNIKFTGKNDDYLITPTDSSFVPMSRFSLSHMKKEIADATIEVS